MARRTLLAAVTAGLATVLAACSGRRRPVADGFATTEESLTSPSGEWEAILAQDGQELRPTIRDVSGTTVWADERSHPERFYPGVRWEQQADVLWILSTDIGHSSVRIGDDGTWNQVWGAQNMPADIADFAG